MTGLAVAVSYHYAKRRQEEEHAKTKAKKQVLVLPLYRMKIVEQKKKDFASLFWNRGATATADSASSTIEMELEELVQVIHHAASDPNIVALYGILGHGFAFSTGGWAHIEELRNALMVFRQSHRIHLGPNLQHTASVQRKVCPNRKPLYVYADTFVNPVMGHVMPEYYLATAFTHIQLQPLGDLNLFGLHATNAFFRDFLTKYGIKVHVYKQGLYKNAVNRFTHSSYTKEHKENVKNILEQINHYVCDGIYHARKSLSAYDIHNFWNMVHRAGSFPASVAQTVGFVDYLPRLDPLEGLVASNQSAERKEEMKQKWGKETDLDQFTAEQTISITEYAKQVAQKNKQEAQQWKLYTTLKTYAEHGPAAKFVLSTMGFKAPNYNIPEVRINLTIELFF